MNRGLVLAFTLLASACAYHNPTAPTSPVDVPVSSIRLDAAIGQGAQGNTAQLTAVLRSSSALPIAGAMVTFTTDGGTLSESSVATDARGFALTTLTANAGSVNVTATSGAMKTSTLVAIQPIPTIPPPVPPSPPTPTPQPIPPAPAPIPPFLVTLTPSATSVAAPAGTLTFTADATQLLTGETVTAYQWDLDGDGKYESTTTGNSRLSAPYTTAGIVTARVLVVSSKNRQVVGYANIVVTN